MSKRKEKSMEDENAGKCPECQIVREKRIDTGKAAFCSFCGSIVHYVIMPKTLTSPVRGKNHKFRITVALCPGCGEELNPPGLLDQNNEELDRQYREAVEQEYGLGSMKSC